MFTGIVSAVGRVERVRREGAPGAGNGAGVILAVRAPFRGVRRGESIAINGACLTVERVTPGGFAVHAVTTTLDRTLIGEWTAGRRVNLERALRAADRLGGHFVQGHVDGVAAVVRGGREGDAWVYELSVPAGVGAVAAPLGAIAVDGVSLTITDVPAPGVVRVALVPYTRTHTTLGTLVPGDRVHVEGDVLAKYVRHLCRLER